METSMHLAQSPIEIVSFLSPNYEAIYRYIADQIAVATAAPIEFGVGVTFEDFLAYDYDLAFACGFWYIHKTASYVPLAAPIMNSARYHNTPVYFVDVIARIDDHAVAISQLKGRILGYNEQYSLSGYQALAVYLQDRQSKPSTFFGRLVKTDSHLNSIRQVIAGEVDCAAIDSTVLDREFTNNLKLKEQIKIVASLGPYPAPPLLFNQRLSQAQRSQIADVIFSLPDNLLAPYNIKSYRPVNEAFYAQLKLIKKEN